MGRGGARRQGQWQTPWGKGAAPKGKGLGAPGAGTFAVKMDATYHVEVLRPYPAEDSSVFVHKGGARKDSDTITLEGMSARLHAGNFEGANRSGRWLSMLAASVARGAQIATYARDHFDATGLGEIATAAGPEIQRACEILDATKKCEPTAAEVETSVQTLLSYCADEGLTAHFQRSAVLAANIYNFSMNALEARGNKETRKGRVLDCPLDRSKLSAGQAAAVLAHRGQWTTELAKNLGALPAPVRDFLQNPANDEALLRALTAAYNHQVLDSQRPVAAAGGDPLGNYGYAAPPFTEPAPPAPAAAAAAAPAEDPLGASQAPAAGPTLFGRKRPAPAEASADRLRKGPYSAQGRPQSPRRRPPRPLPTSRPSSHPSGRGQPPLSSAGSRAPLTSTRQWRPRLDAAAGHRGRAKLFAGAVRPGGGERVLRGEPPRASGGVHRNLARGSGNVLRPEAQGGAGRGLHRPRRAHFLLRAQSLCGREQSRGGRGADPAAEGRPRAGGGREPAR